MVLTVVRAWQSCFDPILNGTIELVPALVTKLILLRPPVTQQHSGTFRVASLRVTMPLQTVFRPGEELLRHVVRVAGRGHCVTSTLALDRHSPNPGDRVACPNGDPGLAM